MTVQEFVKKYNEFNSENHKQAFLSKRIVNNYINFEKKDVLCQEIINASMETIIGNKTVFQQNSLVQHVMFTLITIGNYTDIDINFKNMLEEYNLLNKNKLIKLLISLIDKDDYQEFEMVMAMKIDDYLMNLNMKKE